MEDINLKLEKLKEYLKSLGKVAVAFSGGVDSTFLLKIAYEVLGDNVLAVTLKSDVFPQSETEWTKEFCKKEESLTCCVNLTLSAWKDLRRILQTDVIYVRKPCLPG